MRRVGAIDIGTNSFLCLVAEVESGKTIKTISDNVQIVRLGEGVHKNREFLPQALSRAQKCLKDFRKILDQNNVKVLQAVATSAARDVKNGQELFKIGEELDIPIKTISGPEEARLTYQGVLTNPKFDETIVVIDVGGGSTEITFRDKDGNIQGQSLDLGGVRLTEMFITQNPVSSTELEKLSAHVKSVFAQLPKLKNKKLVGVAGTPTTLAALNLGIDYTQDVIEGATITTKEMKAWIKKLAAMSLEERSRLKGLEPKRADIIIAGLNVLLFATKSLGGTEIRVSTRGVRYGLAAELGAK